jgi:tRNA (adenine57-N1/adenine58-N1)-methyltransferase catalytic subunit
VSGPFEPGERALFIDARGRHYLVRLQSGGTFHTHGGALSHDLVLGNPEGTQVHTASGMELRAFRPRLADYVLKMPRGAQVVYPKDLGAILVWADIRPGAHVLEAGTGSGALCMALCRATGPEGSVVSYDLRPDFQERASANVESFLGKLPGWLDVREGDVAEAAETGERFDRCVLDLPNPWDLIGPLGGALDPGAILCAYLPTTVQVQQLVLALPAAGYMHLESMELLLRTWHVAERSVRPDHRMTGHTAFLTIARKLP